jgi:hypothetical protein
MSATRVQLIGGNFQDSEGNVLANGYLTLTLNQDATIIGVGQIASHVNVKILLNSSGSIDTTTPQSVWGNDQMSPVNSYYEVKGYKENGQPAWGPNYQQVIGSGGTFDVGTWVPNHLVNWTPPLQTPTLQTNGLNNASQASLNLVNGSGVTITNTSAGNVQISSSGGSTQVGPRPSLGNWHYYSAIDGTVAMSSVYPSKTFPGIGMTMKAVGSTSPSVGHITGGTTEPAQIEVTTPASSASTCALADQYLNIVLTNSTRKLTDWQCRVQPLTNATHERVWIGCYGFSDGQPGELDSDTPTGMVGFRYSTNAGDTSWHFYNNGHVGDTGVSFSTTSSHVFEIQEVGTNIVFLIDGTQVGTSAISLAPSNALCSLVWADNKITGATQAISFCVSWMYWECNL